MTSLSDDEPQISPTSSFFSSPPQGLTTVRQRDNVLTGFVDALRSALKDCHGDLSGLEPHLLARDSLNRVARRVDFLMQRTDDIAYAFKFDSLSTPVSKQQEHTAASCWTCAFLAPPSIYSTELGAL